MTPSTDHLRELAKRLRRRAEYESTEIDPAKRDTIFADALDAIDKLTVERGEALFRHVESETQDALQAIGEEFGILGGEPRIDGIRRLLTELRARADRARTALAEAVEAERERSAKIAVNYIFDNDLAPLHSNQAVAANVSQNIAAAIRSMGKVKP